MTQHTPGPWRACNGAKCPCLTVSCGDHPIAQVTNGDWGDDFASIRLVGDSSLNLKAEAFMDQITYGHINIETARANARLIAAAPTLYEALVKIAACDQLDYWPATIAREALALMSPQQEGAER